MKLTVLIMLFAFQMVSFSQKIEEKKLSGQWITKGSLGDDTLSLHKFSDMAFNDHSFFMATTVFFNKDHTFGTSLFTGESCVQGIFCLPAGSWQFNNMQIDFFKIRDGGNGINCKFPSAIKYEVAKVTDTLLMLKKLN